ncbi:cupin domain-containing protein [Lederbergia panacisoli]|uniref:cupin domain-containing protein n=1 Tax=Lederbergia panacisoli TaxID=1255251 RepID=UPI00214AF655|nr:cupin domain-containing protein [Lederbergia panacisoli]MCR2823509.1 cupin domain-containing protein [Lederbergia panacisoli]
MSKLSITDFIMRTRDGQTLAPEGSNISIAEWSAEGTPEGETPMLMAPLHLHYEDDEAWFILEGTLGFQIGDDTIEANRNEAVIVPRGTPHTFWNPKQENARYLIIMNKQTQKLIDAIHSTSDRSPETMKKLFKQYEAELL